MGKEITEIVRLYLFAVWFDGREGGTRARSSGSNRFSGTQVYQAAGIAIHGMGAVSVVARVEALQSKCRARTTINIG